MLNISRKDQAVYVFYASRTFTSGLTITANIYNGINVLVTGSPFTLTEIGTLGLYGTSFTPADTGTYKILVLEGTTKIASATIKVTESDIESVAEDVTSILDLVENTTFGLAALKTLMDTYQTANQTDLTNIETKVDTILNASFAPVADFDS